MTKSEGELLPCPFCGGEAEIAKYAPLHYRIRCSQCGIFGESFRYKHEPNIKQWNTRTQQPDNQPAVSLEKCAEALEDDVDRKGNGHSAKEVARIVLDAAKRQLKAQGVEIRYD